LKAQLSQQQEAKSKRKDNNTPASKSEDQPHSMFRRMDSLRSRASSSSEEEGKNQAYDLNESSTNKLFNAKPGT